jgi:ribosomal protein S12 methylthiotransferase
MLKTKRRILKEQKNNQEINNTSVITLGCAKNLVDSERFSGLLKRNGIEIIPNPDEAESLIINTCGFIKAAKEENINVILQAAELRRKNKYKKLIVTGCLAERYNNELKSQIKDVDYFLGVNSDERILKILMGDRKYELNGERMLYTPKHFAYLKISEGCNQKCSFCAIPLMRGKHVSEPIEKLVDEAKSLAAQGVKELIIIAQDSTWYGLDLYNKRALPELLEKLVEVEGIDWIRLQYAYPRQFPMEIIDSIANHPKICNYIDIPLQHASDKILRSMRRGVKRQEMEDLLLSFRDKIDNLAIRSTFIVGYPGETDEDVAELLDFINTVQLDRVGVFTYSQEENTGAFILGDNLSQEVKDERRGQVMLLQQEISHRKNKEKIGSTMKVLIDEQLEDKAIGRTEHDSPDVDNIVIFEGESNLKVGEFVNAKITDAGEYELYAEVNK